MKQFYSEINCINEKKRSTSVIFEVYFAFDNKWGTRFDLNYTSLSVCSSLIDYGIFDNINNKRS